MRALMVIAEMGTGGAETVVGDLATHLVGRGDDVVVASEPGWRSPRLRERGVATLDVPLRASDPVALARAVARIRREVRRRPVALVHAHNVRASLAAHLGTRSLRRSVPLVSTVHGLADGDYGSAARVLDRISDRVVAVSDDVAARLREHGLRRTRLEVVENAATEPGRLDRALARAALAVPPEVPVVLCLARLAPPKRHDLLLQAWSEIAAPALLLVAGDGEHRPALEEQVRSTGLGERVRLLGARADVPQLLAASDLLVLPTDREGLPMTVLEAMAAGVPVVASAVGGLRSLDPRSVELVEAGSAPALAASLAALLADPARRADLAARARAESRTRFSAATMRDRYQRIYDELDRGRRP